MSELPTIANVVKVSPDPADVIIDFVIGLELDGIGPDDVDSELPGNLAANVPFVLVSVLDGYADRYQIDSVIDIHVFGGKYSLARDAAAKIEAALLGYPLRVSSGGRSVLVDKVEAPTSTREVEWQRDSDVRRFLGTYTLSIRR